jgi:hypothetical protein
MSVLLSNAFLSLAFVKLLLLRHGLLSIIASCRCVHKDEVCRPIVTDETCDQVVDTFVLFDLQVEQELVSSESFVLVDLNVLVLALADEPNPK